jgi:hypothetical protein
MFTGLRSSEPALIWFQPRGGQRLCEAVLKQEEDEPDHQRTHFIVFRVSIKDGQRVLSVSTVARGHWKIDLETGALDHMKTLSRLPRYKGWADKDWQILHVVNFESLRREVDAALAKAQFCD